MGKMLKRVGGEWVGAMCLDSSPCDDRCVFLMRAGESDMFVCAKALGVSDELLERYNFKVNFLRRSEDVQSD